MIKFNPLTVRHKAVLLNENVQPVTLKRKDSESTVIDAEGLAARILTTKPISNTNILLIALRPVVALAIFAGFTVCFPALGTGMNYIIGTLLLSIPVYKWHRAAGCRAAAERALLTCDIQHDQLNELVELSTWPNNIIRLVSKYHLIRLLRDIAPGEYDEILDANHLSLLVRRLKFYNAMVEPRLTTEILEMFTRTGYANALPSASYLAKYSMRLTVRRAAAVCRNSLRGTWRFHEYPGDTKDTIISDTKLAEEQITTNSFETLPAGTNRISMRRGFLLALFLVCVPYGLYSITKSVLSHAWLLIIPYAFLTFCPIMLVRFTMYPADVRRLRALVKSDKVEKVGMLVEALEWPDIYCQQLAAQGLIKTLPRLKASDVNMLNVQQRELLLHHLTLTQATSQPQLLVVILHALEQIGDHSAIAPVERLASCTPKNSGQIRVKEAAIRCLEYLPYRAELNSANLTLLRASQPAREDESDLLRSGGAGSALSEELLLRPGRIE